jgi:hypothetical protein
MIPSIVKNKDKNANGHFEKCNACISYYKMPITYFFMICKVFFKYIRKNHMGFYMFGNPLYFDHVAH